MTHERCIELLSEHLDGLLSGSRARQVEGHLAACRECAAVEAELRALVTRASALEDREPTRDLWPGIASAIGAAAAGPVPSGAGPGGGARDPRTRSRRRLSFSVPQLAAAGLALAMASASAAWWARPLASPPQAVATAGAEARTGSPGGAAAPDGERGWAEEVAHLEAALAAAEGLDAGTVRLLERNLQIVDRAIRESRAALAEDPGNPFLEEHLERSRARKVATLREAAELAGWPRS